jgi:phosphate starvation-inducible PhoH-like protein
MYYKTKPMTDYNKTPQAQENFKVKTKPKNPIKFQLSLNEEQKAAKQIILDNTITVLTGAAGSGKTLLACQVALDALFRKEIEKIVIARPVITSGEELGFLPGDIKQKLDPYMAPIYDNMNRLYDKTKIEKCIEEGAIEIVPFAFMRGRNMSNSFIIIDESQNVTDRQMELVITRMCMGSKMVIVGDIQQTDLKDKKMSGLYFLNKAIMGNVPGTASVHLKTNHRHPIVEPIVQIYKELNS